MTTVKTARVLIVDDHPFMRRGLAHMIDDLPDLEVCAEADGRFRRARHVRTASARSDRRRHLAGGTAAGSNSSRKSSCANTTRKFSCRRCTRNRCSASGPFAPALSDSSTKGEEVDTYVRALRQVLDGRVFLSQKMTDRLLNRIVSNEEENCRSSVDLLSDRELEVFELIGRGFTTKQIAAKLELSRKTIETYREHIKSKLSLQNGTELARQAVQWVLEQG